jgi:hypothetical protein
MDTKYDAWYKERQLINSFMSNPTSKRLQYKEFLVNEGLSNKSVLTHTPKRDIVKHIQGMGRNKEHLADTYSKLKTNLLHNE